MANGNGNGTQLSGRGNRYRVATTVDCVVALSDADLLPYLDTALATVESIPLHEDTVVDGVSEFSGRLWSVATGEQVHAHTGGTLHTEPSGDWAITFNPNNGR